MQIKFKSLKENRHPSCKSSNLIGNFSHIAKMLTAENRKIVKDREEGGSIYEVRKTFSMNQVIPRMRTFHASSVPVVWKVEVDGQHTALPRST